MIDISIHPPRAGRDNVREETVDEHDTFQSTRPVRGGTTQADEIIRKQIFQSTRPVRGGTVVCSAFRSLGVISIHPPRAGRDKMET